MAKKNAAAVAAHTAPAAVDLEAVAVRQLMQLKPYLIPAGVLVGIAVVAIIAWAYVDNARRRHIAAAYEKLSAAYALDKPGADAEALDKARKRQKDIFKRVVEDFAQTPAALEADYQLAMLAFEAGDYADAAQRFVDFATGHPDAEPLTAMAKLAEGNSLFAAGKVKQAYERFVAVATEYDASLDSPQTAPRARCQAAICAIARQRRDDARKLLERVMASDAADDAVRETAKNMLAKLDLIPAATLAAAATLPPPAAAENASAGTAPEAGEAPPPKTATPEASAPKPEAPDTPGAAPVTGPGKGAARK